MTLLLGAALRMREQEQAEQREREARTPPPGHCSECQRELPPQGVRGGRRLVCGRTCQVRRARRLRRGEP